MERPGIYDPCAAFLEMLDPEQNSLFMDDYLEAPVDLSKVLFICTADNIGKIPESLKDRMGIIHIDGYADEEKLAIAQKYIVPQVKKMTGLSIYDEQISITNEAMVKLIQLYCQEKGVRKLKALIEEIFRKATNMRISEKRRNSCIKIDEFNLSDFVGKPVYKSKSNYLSTSPPGVATGLACTNTGGCLLHIETIKREAGTIGYEKIKSTGTCWSVSKS